MSIEEKLIQISNSAEKTPETLILRTIETQCEIENPDYVLKSELLNMSSELTGVNSDLEKLKDENKELT